jgi:hypothetical protein
MEIDIPSLDDLKFEEDCSCRYRSYIRDAAYKTVNRPKDLKYGEPFPMCIKCQGKGYYLSPVGERLVEFLKKRGLLGD